MLLLTIKIASVVRAADQPPLAPLTRAHSEALGSVVRGALAGGDHRDGAAGTRHAELKWCLMFYNSVKSDISSP